MAAARSGPGATNHFEAGGFVRSNEDVAYPNLMFHFLPIAIRYDGSAPQGHGYQVHVGPMYSDARGSVKIVSTDPRRHPALRFNYLSTEQDRREWPEAVHVARKILTQPALTPTTRASSPRARRSTPTSRSSTGWRATPRPPCTPRARARWASGRTPCSIPMTMKVHGLEGIRVVDASSMPYVTNGNICAPTMMLAEKSADLIRARSSAPPTITASPPPTW
jgi:choline dehydrogenase